MRIHALRAIGRKAVLRRETSPRRVQCNLCFNSIQGNREERICLEVATGFVPGPQYWWMAKQKIYFHAQCLIEFSAGGDVAQGPDWHRTACSVCWRITTRDAEKMTKRKFCNSCAKTYGDSAIRKTLKGLAEVVEEAKGLVSSG